MYDSVSGLKLLAVGGGIHIGIFPEGFAEMELVWVADVLTDLFYRQGAFREKALGLVDTYAGQEFKRGLAYVAAEKLCEVGRGKAHGIGKRAYIYLLHIVLLHIRDGIVHLLA